MAPEILKGVYKPHSFGVDVWSLGCILYMLFLGKPPFDFNIKFGADNVKEAGTKFYEFEGEFFSNEGKDLV